MTAHIYVDLGCVTLYSDLPRGFIGNRLFHSFIISENRQLKEIKLIIVFKPERYGENGCVYDGIRIAFCFIIKVS